MTAETLRYSSDFPAPARRRFLPIPARTLIGDDEHGWSADGIYNFEGGCYAKTIKLTEEAEPDIFAAANSWGTVLENVILDPATREPDFDDGSLTENTRAAYPLERGLQCQQDGRFQPSAQHRDADG